MKTDPTVVSISLAAKLGSLVVHVDEATSSDGHALDLVALQGIVEDPEVQEFLEGLREMALVPVKRVQP